MRHPQRVLQGLGEEEYGGRPTMDALAWVRKQVEQADTDVLRELVKVFTERQMAEEANVINSGGVTRGECVHLSSSA